MIENTNNKFSLKIALVIGGTYMAWCMGAGFASGQDSLQNFGGFGIMGYFGIIIGMAIHGYTAVSFMKAGRREDFETNMDVYRYYAGKYGSKVLFVMAIAFTFLSPTTLISAFGSSLNQQFGTPVFVGNVILGILCIITILTGFQGVVNIISKVSFLIVIIAMITSLVYISQNFSGFSEGVAMATSADQFRIGATWVDAGINYATWAPIVAAPFMARIGSKLGGDNKTLVLGGTIAVTLYGVSLALILTAFFCNYGEVSQSLIPTLFIAAEISQLFAIAFIACIFCAIYTSAVPEFLVLTTMFFKDKTKNFKLFAVIAISLATLTSTILPYDQLFNYVYVFYGYTGMVIVLLVIIKDIKVFRASKALDKNIK